MRLASRGRKFFCNREARRRFLIGMNCMPDLLAVNRCLAR